MKTAYRLRSFLLGIMFLVFGLSPLSSVSAQNAGWKGKILTEAGVRVVSNLQEPLYDDIRLDIVEDLRIGKEGDAQALFYRIRDIAADAQGNIYVDDYSNGRVQVFNPRGEYLRTIGRPGQGPGEFEYPKFIRIGGPKGLIHVMDRSRRINLFDSQGTYLRSVTPEGGFKNYFPDADGGFTIIGVARQDDSLNPEDVLSRISEDGKRKAVLARFPYTLYMEKMEGGVLSASTGYELELHAAPLPGDALVYGYSRDYELVVIGQDDRKTLVIRKEENRPDFTAAEKAEFKRIPLPKLKPYFYGILTDSDGRIYVQKNMNTATKRGFGPVATAEMQCDVFSPTGVFLFRANLPPNTRAIDRGYVYSYDVDEDQGLEFARRFKIRNYQGLPKK